MGVTKPQRPPARPRMTSPTSSVDVTPFSQRLIADASQRAADQLRDRAVLQVDLKVGDNVINHGLGRKPRGATVTPSVADASWAWSLRSPTTTQVTLTCVGVPQPGAVIEVFA